MLASGVAVGACVLLLAACGSTAAPTTGAPATGAPATSAPASGASATSATGSSSAGQAAAAAVSLDVTFAASANVPAAHYTLHCEPASGTVADPAVACTKLLTGTSLFAPRPAHELCPMIMLGAGRATVTGTYLGQNVHETIVDGGCDLSRWAKLKAVFA
jgi:hypothetical protein